MVTLPKQGKKKLRSVGLLCKTRGEADLDLHLHLLLAVRKSSCQTSNR